MSPANQPSDSLTEALAKARIPSENHEFILRFTNDIGIAEYRVVEASKTYIKATRRDGRPDLHIYWGYTNGFTSEEEIVGGAGDAAERKTSSRKGTWYVAHPETKVYDGSARTRSASTRREAGFCDCGMQLSWTGVCANCD